MLESDGEEEQEKELVVEMVCEVGTAPVQTTHPQPPPAPSPHLEQAQEELELNDIGDQIKALAIDSSSGEEEELEEEDGSDSEGKDSRVKSRVREI